VTVFRNYSPNDLALELIMLVAIYGLFYPLASGGLVFGVSERYFGRATTIGVSLRHSWSQLGRLCVVVLVSLLAILSGLMFLVVPGV
jgi:hypothetical protein